MTLIDQLADIDAVVFDLDDTLVDWWTATERAIAAIADAVVLERLQAHCRRFYWERRPGTDDIEHRNTWKLHDRRHDDWPIALADLTAAEVVAMIGRFDATLSVELFPDTAATLDRLTGHRHLAVLSNNQRLPREAARLGLDRWFDVMVAAPPHASKPAPDPFLDVAARLGVAPERCAYVGDSVRVDVLGSRNAGMVPVWFNVWGDAWPGRPSDVIEINRLSDLVAVAGSA